MTKETFLKCLSCALVCFFTIGIISWSQVNIPEHLIAQESSTIRILQKPEMTIQNFQVKEKPNGWEYSTPFPVDVVYTWVNGSDPKHIHALEELKNRLRKNKLLTATKAKNLGNNRFADNGALRFSLRSLEKHANWVRHVFIVTNGQIPSWLNHSNPRLTIVNHKEIFDEPQYLPTFSSHAIEHNVHKIKGLSERFIYMNDDFFYGRKVLLQDFYTEKHGTKVYLSWNVATKCGTRCNMAMIKNGKCDDVCNYDHCAWDGGDCDNVPVGKRPKDSNQPHCDYTNALFYSNAIFGRTFGYRKRWAVAHSPLFMEISVKKELDRRFPNEVNETSRRQLRSPLDFQFEFAYMNFLMDAYNDSRRFQRQIKSADVSFIMVTNNLKKTQADLDKLRRTKSKFICINDNIDYSDPTAAERIAHLVEHFYLSMFPNRSSFEITT